MSIGGSQKPVVTTETRSPWAGAVPHLTNVLGEAQNLYSNDVGYRPYMGQTQADVDPLTQQGMDLTQSLATRDAGGSGGLQAARSLAEQMQARGGLSSDQQSYVLPTMAGNLNNFAGMFANRDSGTRLGMEAVGQKFGDIYNEASGNENPYLQSILAAQGSRIADKVNSSMSGQGRYGSGAHTDVLTRGLAEAANPILAQDYSDRQARRMGALAGQEGVGRDIASEYGNREARGLSSLQGMEGTLRDYSDVTSGGLARAMQGSTLIPELDAAQYTNADRLMGLGEFNMNRQQADIDRLVDVYNASEARPWEELARYSGIAGGMGALGGTTVGTRPSNAAPTGAKVLGGALAGAGLGSKFMPGIGTGLGALGGGLMGLF